MTEALFSITHAGELISVSYYTITQETLEREIISKELINEILNRCSSAQGIPGGDSIDRCFVKPQHINTRFTFEDLQVEILKKHDHKIEFFVSRDIPAAVHGRQRPIYH